MNKNYVIVLAASLLLTACGQKKEDKGTFVRPVKTATVESRSEIKKDFSGIVEAVEYVKLAFRVSGQIINLPVIEGEKVKKDNLLQRSILEISPCNMQPIKQLTKQQRHKWNATNAC